MAEVRCQRPKSVNDSCNRQRVDALADVIRWEHYFEIASRGTQTKVRMAFRVALGLITFLVWI
jgi:hypothetical protein